MLLGVATQGLGLVDEWTTSYRMLYANKSDEEFKEYSENGNFPKVIYIKRNHDIYEGQCLTRNMSFIFIGTFFSTIYLKIHSAILKSRYFQFCSIFLEMTIKMEQFYIG